MMPQSRARPLVVGGWALACGPLVFALLQVPAAAWCAMFGYHAGCLAAARWAGGIATGPRLGARRAMGIAAVSVAVTAGAGVVARAVALLPEDAAAAWAGWGLRPPHDLAWLAYYVIVNPWVEERYWRGALLAPAVVARLGTAPARALAVLGFGIHHLAVLGASFGLARGALLVLPVLAAGAAWTLMRLRSGGVSLAVASHLGTDLALAAVYVWMWRG
jgi:hypothetical protein